MEAMPQVLSQYIEVPYEPSQSREACRFSVSFQLKTRFYFCWRKAFPVDRRKETSEDKKKEENKL